MQESSVDRDAPRRVMNRGPNWSIYGSSNYGTEPRCIYFYYLISGTDDVAAYYFDNGAASISFRDLKERAAELVHNHRDGGDMAYSLPRGFDEPWRRRSWLLLVLGDPHCQFKLSNAIDFLPGPYRASNQAFRDGHDFPVAARNGDRLSAVCCINHMHTNEHRDDLLVNEIQEFRFRLNYHCIGFRKPRPVDTGGTNMGPPVPPPA